MEIRGNGWPLLKYCTFVNKKEIIDHLSLFSLIILRKCLKMSIFAYINNIL